MLIVILNFGKLNIPLGTYKRHLQSVRSKANIGASIWKIALTVTFSYLLLPKEHFENVFVSFVNNPQGNIPIDSSIHSNADLNTFDIGSSSPNQYDLPVRHKRQMPFPPADDNNNNNTVIGKIAGNQDQMSLFANSGNDDDTGVGTDPFDFQPDRVFIR